MFLRDISPLPPAGVMSLRDNPPYRIAELVTLLKVSRTFIEQRMKPTGPIGWWKVGKVVFLDYDDVERVMGNPNSSTEIEPPAAALRLIERAGL